MKKREFYRKYKEKLPVVAICYDFDKTLSPDDMQAQGYIQSVGFEVAKFWEEANGLACDNQMDSNLAYMYKMVQEAEGNFAFTRRALEDYGSKVELFPGVDTWFERIRKFAIEHGVIVEHYIISSGLKEMIEGTKMAKEGAFERIFASSFYFNERGVAIWPAQAINYTSKTQFLFRIEKGVLDVNDPGVNEHFPKGEIRVPFRNMVYVGDSDTDIPCMKLVTDNGGHSIGVYNPYTGDKNKVYKMIKDRRIRHFAAADYTEGSEMDSLIKAIILKTVSDEVLEDKYIDNLNETDEAIRVRDTINTLEQAAHLEDQTGKHIKDILENPAAFEGEDAKLDKTLTYIKKAKSTRKKTVKTDTVQKADAPKVEAPKE